MKKGTVTFFRWMHEKKVTVPFFLLLAAPATAQPRVDGYASLFVDHLPNAPNPATELRARLFADFSLRPTEVLTLIASGFVDGLVADRGGSRRDANIRPQEIVADVAFARADLRIGLGHVVWGRLDELQPSDVVNPLDIARFFFEGRNEARLPVALVRGRVFFSEDASVEAVYVPVFRSGRFDQLDEGTSPFNLGAGEVSCLAIEICPPLERREPERTFGNAQGGVRFSGTARRVDYAVALYRGFRSFGTIAPEPFEPSRTPSNPSEPLRLIETFPRFTMVAADMEAVRGKWVVRAEVAAFDGTDRTSWDAGIGIDRKTGDYRLSGSLLVHGEPSDTSLSFLLAADRTFDRERYRTRTFGVVNTTHGSSFLRNVTTTTLRDNVALEGSIGWFFGDRSFDVAEGRSDTIGRFADRDFLYARLKVYF
jgi:hypothetical protein